MLLMLITSETSIYDYILFYAILIRPSNLPLQLQLINLFGLLYKVRNRILRKTH